MLRGQDGYQQLGSYLQKLTQEALRERCLELALYIRAGVDTPVLVDEVVELSREAWALRDAASGDN